VLPGLSSPSLAASHFTNDDSEYVVQLAADWSNRMPDEGTTAQIGFDYNRAKVRAKRLTRVSAND
jgi:hypothetical protein